MPRPDKSGLAMTEKDERYIGIMRLPHFLRKFVMIERGRKYKKVIKKDRFPFSREWHKGAGMTEERDTLINYFDHKKKNNKRGCSENFYIFFQFYNVL